MLRAPTKRRGLNVRVPVWYEGQTQARRYFLVKKISAIYLRQTLKAGQGNHANSRLLELHFIYSASIGFNKICGSHSF
jgi:hypothetical protein